MGYTTEFRGEFKLNKPLKKEHKKYLEDFNESRRMKRDEKKTEVFDDPVRKAVGLPVGPEGAYYVGSVETFDIFHDRTENKSIIDHNTPPGGKSYESIKSFGEQYAKEEERIKKGKQQPGLWCNWVPNENGTAIEWDGGEKFYQFVPWIKYLIAHFLKPWGYKLNGEVDWRGEEWDDNGTIIIKNNVLIQPKL